MRRSLAFALPPATQCLGGRAFGWAPRPWSGRKGLAKPLGGLALAAATGGRRRFNRQRGCGRRQKKAVRSPAEMTPGWRRNRRTLPALLGLAPQRTSGALVLGSIAHAHARPERLLTLIARPLPASAAARRWAKTWRSPGLEGGGSIPRGSVSHLRHSRPPARVASAGRRATCRRAPCNLACRATAGPWRGRRRASCRASG